MAEYKVIFRCDETTTGSEALTWEAGCPLIFEAIQVSRNIENGQAFLQGKLRNISDQKVQSFKALITIGYEDGNKETVEFNPLDADILDGAVYELDPVLLKQGDVSKASGKIESVKLTDGKWESAANSTIVPEPQPIGLSEEAIQERYDEIWKPLKSAIPLHERKGFAANRLEEHDGWWLCPCGQANVGKGACAKCGASLDALQKPDVENEETLLSAAKERRISEGLSANLKAEKHKKARTFIIIGIAVAIVIIAAAVFAFQSWQNAQYEEGASAFESHDYETAAAAFQSLGYYKDSNEWAQYSEAMAAYEVEAYGTAAYIFDSLEGFEDSEAMKNQAEFMGNISEWLNKPCAGKFYYAPYNENKPNGSWRDLGCTITLNTDGSCKINISQDGNEYELKYESTANQYLGEWEGTWSPSDRELIFKSFPDGEKWKVEITTYSQTSTSGGKKTEAGPIIRSQTTGQSFWFSVFD